MGLVVLVGVSGQRQVHLRPQPLQAHRGRLQRLLPRARRRRRERPVRDPGRVRRPALHRRHPAAPRAAHRRRRHQRPAAGAGLAGQARPQPRRPGRRDRPRRARVAGGRAQPWPRRPRLRRATSSPASTATSSARCAGWARRASVASMCSAVSTRSRPPRSRERPWNDRRDATGPFDIIGDVHGCASELRTLLTELGWHAVVRRAAGRRRQAPARVVRLCSSATWSTVARTRRACFGW